MTNILLAATMLTSTKTILCPSSQVPSINSYNQMFMAKFLAEKETPKLCSTRVVHETIKQELKMETDKIHSN